MSKIVKVIKKIDDFTLVINAGSNDGIKKGMEFLIYEIGEELFDPDTNESLGKLETVKGTAESIHIQENITTIKSNMYENQKKQKTIKRTGTGLAAMVAFGGGTEEIVEMGEKILQPFNNTEVGDSVKVFK
ncbi:hypothetical protein [Aliarcobacter butzleri]|uniref:hypothetical protein n=1 Tax=Aliarcobacter butzleri TaxID=28197 RepID=UPI00191AD44D|nr:hypothetical protein [Aliarcobacter butzleri]